VGRRIESKGEAIQEAEKIRTLIRDGKFRAVEERPALAKPVTFSEFAEVWKAEKGVDLVGARDNSYRLETLKSYILPDTAPPLTFGEKPVRHITANDIEALRRWRKMDGRSAVTINHDVKLLRKMFNWGIKKRLVERTPFRVEGVAVINLERETPRAMRFQNDEDEQKLLDAANPHLRALITAMLDTACRPGELLSLQWKDVNLKRKEITIRAEKAKTRTGRTVPLSTRLIATLELRRIGPDGKEFGPDAYVFGNEVGERVKSVRTAWDNAAEKAGLTGLQLRDLRHEAGSRFDEAGVSINYVSKMLGHANLTTTTRYLNIQRRELHRAVEKLEAHQKNQKAVAQDLHTSEKEAQAGVPLPAEASPSKSLVS
jgi:integrase